MVYCDQYKIAFKMAICPNKSKNEDMRDKAKRMEAEQHASD